MKQALIAFAGIVGGVALLFSTLGYLLLGEVAVSLMVAHLVVGVIGVAIWVLGSRSHENGQVRKEFAKTQIRFYSRCGAQLLSLICVLGGSYFLVSRYDQRWDLTEQKMHSLAPQSFQIIQELKEPLHFVAFDRIEEFPLAPTLELLSRYSTENPEAVTIETVDPVVRPDLVEEYGLNPGDGLVVRFGNPGEQRVERLTDISEEAITAAVLKLVRGEQKKIYVLQGHGEPSLTSNRPDGIGAFAAAIEREHLAVSELMLIDKPEIPADAAALIVAAPKKSLLKTEEDALRNYLSRGGRILFFAEPLGAQHLQRIAAEFGVQIDKTVIIDQTERAVGAPQLGAQPVVRSFHYHSSTAPFTEKTPVVFNIATAVRAHDQQKEGLEVVELMTTSSRAWAESRLEEMFESTPPRAEKDPEDMAGPVSVAVAVEWEVQDQPEAKALSETGRLIVVGDSDWILNANLHWLSNKDLGLNLLGWLSEVEGGVTIRPKSYRASLVTMSRSTYMFILVVSLLVPELLLLIGLFVWYWRNRISEVMPDAG